jgi:3-dehydroquinate dehydratase-1
VDAFAAAPEKLLSAIPRLNFPLLLTVRHPKEGGAAFLSLTQRRDLIRQFLPFAQWMDVEVRSLRSLQKEIHLGKSERVRLLVSDHFFASTPSLERLDQREKLARQFGAEIFKVASLVRTPRELERLFSFLNQGQARGLAVMGMGPLGQVSRLLMGACGSALSYGYLDQAQVPGQWEATLLKKRLLELVGRPAPEVRL